MYSKTVFDAQRPIYVQLIERVKTRIVSGEYEPGGQIPSVRELADTEGVNPNTMQKALAELERIGLLNSQRTVGRFITEDNALIAKLRAELAEGYIARFIGEMAALGVTPDEAVKLILDFVKENGGIENGDS